MDRKAERLDSLISKVTTRDLINVEAIESALIYSVIGFVPASDGVDNGIVISNLAYLLAQRGLNTCVVDFKVFYPNLAQFLNVDFPSKGNGLIKVLKSDKIDIRDEITATKYDRLFVLSPSQQDLMEEYFDFDFDHIERTIHSLKQMFDIVLIDVPNNPPLEFCLGALKYCHIGFFTASERIDAVVNMVKLLDFVKTLGISTAKLTNVIMMNLHNLDFDYDVFKETGFNVAIALPFVKDAIVRGNHGELYVKDNPLFNRQFMKEINRLAKLLADQ